MDQPRILIIDDDTDVLLALKLLLKGKGYSVTAEGDPKNVAAHMGRGSYDAIFLDMNFSKNAMDGREGLYWIKKIREADPEAMVIPITAFGDVELAMEAVREGAADFILKPWKNEKLLSTLSMVLALKRSMTEVNRLRLQQMQLVSDMDRLSGEMIGEGPAMREVFDLVRKVAATDASVLILGENGTGKELVARALHRLSRRSEGVFIGLDMASISESLFESELFGHVRGSFTGARESRIGRFENASGGSLFLDEIGNLSLPMQAKLLRAIETREITPVGSNKPRPIDIRLICATNMPIHDMVARKEFRQDLLYRINTIEIRLPPLRERKEDIPLLVGHFASMYCRKYKIAAGKISPETVERLKDYDWPGNVRELKHAIERAVIVGERGTLKPEDFLFGRRGQSGSLSLPPSGPVRPQGDGSATLERVERDTVRMSLERNSGNVSRAARELGITRASLYRRIQKYGLEKLSG
jgi:two-component system, NtrC family, response regulator HydG